MVWTFILLLSFYDIAHAYCYRQFWMQDGGLLIIGGCLLLFLYGCNRGYGEKIETFLEHHHRLLLSITLAVLLGWQLYASFGGYFSTGWDARIIRETIFYEVRGNYERINHHYFSCCQNNALLVWLYKQIVTLVDRTVGIGLEYSMVAFQCLLDVCTVYLTYRIAFDLFHSYRAAWLTYAVAYLFVGLSPWFIIVYSDATGIVLPVLLIRLYQKGLHQTSNGKSMTISGLIGFFAMAGFYLKPQIFIAAIAMVLLSIPKLFIKSKKTIQRTLRNLVTGIFGAFLFISLYHSFIVPSLNFNIDKEFAIGWQHYLMMGLNDTTDGGYYLNDVNFTNQFVTSKERNSADLEVARQRISDYGILGMVRHLSRKELSNYGDGSFSWGMEGEFFDGIPSWANNRISPLMHEILFPEGKLFMAVTSCQQLIWITILVMCMFAAKTKKKEAVESHQENVENVIFLSLIGLTLFELIFEARARYLFCYAPVFVLTAVLGMRNLFHCVQAKEG